VYTHLMDASNAERQKKLEDYYIILAVCHACVIDPDTGTYQGSSPDEVALVQGAAEVGIVLESLSFGEVVLKMPNGSKREFKIKQMIEFDSDRKRMSVVVHDKTNNVIELFMKGADMMVLERLRKNADGTRTGFENDSHNMDHINAFSSEGLRTLVIAKKFLKDLNDPKPVYYDEWEVE